MATLLSDDEITGALDDLTGWSRDQDNIVASYDAPDFPTAITLVRQVADAAEQVQHHPDIDIRWKLTTWRLSTHSDGGVTQADIDLAHRISELAAALGATATAGP